MPDVWSSVSELDSSMQERLAEVLETRGADPQQQAMRRMFLASIPFPTDARVMEVGCGTGVLSRTVAGWPGVASVVGVDPAPSLIARARVLARGQANLTFAEADGRNLPFEDATFNVVIFDSTLCHIPGPETALSEAFRVLRPSGWLAAFDGDYATATVALGPHDPLQVCVDATMAVSVTDRWLLRRLRFLVQEAGFDPHDSAGYSFVETNQGGYMLTVIDRGADILVASNLLDAETATALKAEARQRVAEGHFFGHIAYGSVIAKKP
jgi:ubiquinone/menaquinone biosynthesis C-methylase UbiE